MVELDRITGAREADVEVARVATSGKIRETSITSTCRVLTRSSGTSLGAETLFLTSLTMMMTFLVASLAWE